MRPGPNPATGFVYMMYVLYFASVVDGRQRWYCDCGADIHHRVIAYRRMQDVIGLFMLEVEKCAVVYTTDP